MFKKISLLHVLSGIVLFMVALTLFFAKNADAYRSFFTRHPAISVATTTVSYMTPGTATTTYTYSTWDVDEVDVFLNFTASSTKSELNWNWQFSNNNVDWFTIAQKTNYATSSNVFNGATTTNFTSVYFPVTADRWNPNLAATSSITFKAPKVASNFQRVQFSIPSGIVSANGAVWAEFTLKRYPGY